MSFSAFGCPYSQFNLSKDSALLDRLVGSGAKGDSGAPESGLKKIKEEVADDVAPSERAADK